MRRALVLLLLLAPIAAQEREPDDARAPVRLRLPVGVSEAVEVGGGGGAADRALEAYREWKRGGAPMDADAMAGIYGAAGRGEKSFKTVAYLIASGKIPDADSVAMAQVREAEIERLIFEIGGEKRWKIARSDSGNVSSGMKSDLDQTFYVFEARHDGEQWVYERRPELDGTFIREFESRWAQRHGEALSLASVDIASIEGRNRFPDPRVQQVHGYWNEFGRATEALRNTPGAYTYQGAVAHQMQFRALRAVLEGSQRAYRVYAPEGDAPKAGWEARRGSVDEAVRTMFGAKPELTPGFAFGAAVANFLELQHYMRAKKFESKYHLRTFEDSVFSQWLVEIGHGQESKVDLLDLEPGTRAEVYDLILQRVFPGAEGAELRRRHAMAFEVSVALRRAHKTNETPDAARLFDALGRELLGEGWRGGSVQVEVVRRRYRELASEFCLESAFHTAPEAFALLVGKGGAEHLRLDRYRRLLGLEHTAEWFGRLRDAVHLTFLYGIYDLGWERSRELTRRLSERFPEADLSLMRLWTRGRLQAVEGVLRNPRLYAGLYADALKARVPELIARAHDHVARELGFEPHVAEVAGEIARRGYSWNLGRFVRRTVYDPGTVDGAAKVLEEYVTSKGDWDRVRAVMVREFVLALPLIGQIAGAAQADWKGLAMMGAAMAHPVAAGLVVAYSVAESGYAMYVVEVARPRAGNVEDAVYRGFVGPELQYFEEAPQPLTDAERAELERLRAERTRLRQEHGHEVFVERGADWRARLDRAREARARFPARDAELTAAIDKLETKKRAYGAFRDGAWAGGYFTEAGAQKLQRLFENSLLRDIEPIASWSPAGIVDFRVEHDPERLARLADEVANAPDIDALLEAVAAYGNALRDRKRWERARRYRERAFGRGPRFADLSEEEKRASVVELRHKLRRDSIYPAFRAWGTTPEEWVDRFLEGNRRVLDELVAMDLVTGDADPEYVPGDPRPRIRFRSLQRFPEDVKRRLVERLRTDYERSRALWERFEVLERAADERERRALARRKQAMRAQAAGLVVDSLLAGEDGDALRRLYAAMRDPEAPAPMPHVDATVVLDGSRTEREGPGYHVLFDVKADFAHFRPPYRAEVRALDADGARKAAAEGRAGDVPLLPDARGRLAMLADALEEGEFAFLVTATCDALGEGAPALRRGPRGFLLGQHLARGRPPATTEAGGEVVFFTAPMDYPAVYERLKRLVPELADYPLPKRVAEYGPPGKRSNGTVEFRPGLMVLRAADVAERLRRRRSADGMFAGAQHHDAGARIRIRALGQVRHVLRVPEPLEDGRIRVRTIGRPRIRGFENGPAEVLYEAFLPGGETLTARFTYDMRVTAPGEAYRGVVESLGDLRARVEEDPDDLRRRIDYASKLLTCADFCLTTREHERWPEWIDAALAEYETIPWGRDPRRHRTFLGRALGIAHKAGDAKGIDVARWALGTLTERFPDAVQPGSHRALAEFVYAVTGSLADAREHYAGNADDLAWWPGR